MVVSGRVNTKPVIGLVAGPLKKNCRASQLYLLKVGSPLYFNS